MSLKWANQVTCCEAQGACHLFATNSGHKFIDVTTETLDAMLSLNTTQIDTTVAMKAYNLYKSANYSEAMPALQEILDMEPTNWQARLFLGACFFKTGQPMAAERAFRFVYEKCSDEVLKQKACFAMQVVKNETGKQAAEFGSVVERETVKDRPTIESLIG